MTSNTTTIASDVDTTVYESDTAPATGLCKVRTSDNWFFWLMQGIFFVACIVAFFMVMTKKMGLNFSMGRKCKIYTLITNSLALASIITSSLMTGIVMSQYTRCDTLQSHYIVTKWFLEDAWEATSLFGFVVWCIGVVAALSVYLYFLCIKFKDNKLEQEGKERMIERGEDPEPNKTLGAKISAQFKFEEEGPDDIVLGGQQTRGCKWLYKLLFFVVNFAFCAVIRPYYQVGVHPSGHKCACVEPNIGLITEIYTSALIALLFWPIAKKCTECCSHGDGSVTKCCASVCAVYTWICIVIVIITPAVLIGFRLSSFVIRVTDEFVPDDFNLIIWFFDAISNLAY
eukprot:164954_1